MKLRQRMLVVFAATMVAGLGVLYLISRNLLLSIFRQLEAEQMRQDVEYAITGLDEEYRSLGSITIDYSYSDRTYEYMTGPSKEDMGKEFQNGEMEDLGLNLIVVRDLQGNTMFAKAYDRQMHQEVAVPTEFLQDIFSRPQMKPEAVAGDWVEVSICDTGAGIPEESRNKILEPFFTTKAVGKGTGQGLALARAIVFERHGGTPGLVSEMGRGTTFFVRLPLRGAAVREEAPVQ